MWRLYKMATMDVPPDTWLTLTEAAARTGHTREAIRQRIRRRKLPATKGNDGHLRVRMRDLADLPPPDVSADDHGQPGGVTRDATVVVPLATLADLRTTVDDLRTTLVATLDKAQADRLVDHGRAERAEAQAAAAAARATLAENRLAAVEATLAEARTPWAVRVIRAWRR